ncbi:MAG TPA: hypothetical protein VF297_23220 [Pyrinomonadaceae bacterium]
MSPAKLARALALGSLLCGGGCLVEPSPNAPTANTGAGERGAVAASPSPESSPTPTLSAEPSLETPGGPSSVVESGGKLEGYVRAAAAGLAPEQREALGRVNTEARRLLALRGYLRSGAGAASRWAWSREHIESYEKSPEYAAALGEIEKVRREFEGANPGHTLRVNTQVRSLDEQLKKWNENDSVARASEELLARAREELAGASYASAPTAADVQRFESFLRGTTTRTTPTLAVPGLSPHGQSRAFDFQVMRGSQLVAGPSGAGRWDSEGWTEKVRAAVTRASTKFAGPLASPREPWHYDYRP